MSYSVCNLAEEKVEAMIDPLNFDMLSPCHYHLQYKGKDSAFMCLYSIIVLLRFESISRRKNDNLLISWCMQIFIVCIQYSLIWKGAHSYVCPREERVGRALEFTN